MSNLIEIIDLEVCNVISISNMLENIGFETKVVKTPSSLELGKKLILPGVGSFGPAAKKLKDLGWLSYLKSNQDDFSLLGICIGMHLLGNGSEEGPGEGLGFIDATVKLIRTKLAPVPHMGWEELQSLRSNFSLNQVEPSKFYFSHSYFMECENDDDVAAAFSYGGQIFPAIVSKENITGIQFHPEKSHRHGAKLLRNFAELNV